MAHLIDGLLFAAGVIPLWQAWQGNRQTSLSHAVLWALAAWLAWGVVLSARTALDPGTVLVLRHLALCLTACAGIAVLGARRPGVGAWNFVVVGLLAVLLLPVAEGWLVGTPLYLNEFHTTCLAATLALGILNYLPTRLAPAALLLGLACAWEVATLTAFVGTTSRAVRISGWCLALVPWVAYAAVRRPAAASAFDELWLAFRDRFGFVWGQRLRDQFNSSAAHAGWPVVLRWRGLRRTPGSALPDTDAQSAMVATLRALLKRFGADREAG